MNDPRITAYALNELQGNERDCFESDLAADQHLQAELESASRVADALAQVMVEPAEGLEPQARERLLRAIVANQESFRARRKIIRFAVPVSLAAAASIAVLLLVSGGTTTQNSAVAAASAPISPAGIPANDESMVISLSGPIHRNALRPESEAAQQTEFALTGWRTVQMRESAGAAGQLEPFDQTEIRVRGLRWESPQTLGLGEQAVHTEFLAP